MHRAPQQVIEIGIPARIGSALLITRCRRDARQQTGTPRPCGTRIPLAAFWRRIITFTQNGGEINVVVAGINVGASTRSSTHLRSHVVGRRTVDERVWFVPRWRVRPLSFEEVHTVEQTQHETFPPQECPDCHALAADLEAHKQWHSRLVHDIATAVDRDVTRRVGAQ
jgi:hypothetical protein